MLCKYCGNEVADGVKFCPSCGKPFGETMENIGIPNSTTPIEKTGKVGAKKRIASVFGIVSIILAVGSFAFGLLSGLLSVVAAVVGLVLSSDVRKITNNKEGTGAFVASLTGLILGALLTLSCVILAPCTCGGSIIGVGTSSLCESVDSSINDATDVAEIRELISTLNN